MVGNADPARSSNSKLIRYLEAHQGSATCLVATPSSNAADTIITATGKSVMALGGFTGSDPILTASKLKAQTRKGVVRYFLLNGGNLAPPAVGYCVERRLTLSSMWAGRMAARTRWRSGLSSSAQPFQRASGRQAP